MNMSSHHRSHQNGGGSSASASAAAHNMSSIHNTSSSSLSSGMAASAAVGKMTNLEHLMNRLVAKVVSQNVSPDVPEKKKLEFVAKSYNYLSKVITSDSFAPSYDSFELAEKTKKKRNNYFKL